MQEKILAAAVKLAASKGLARLTRKMVARNIRVADSLVSYHFKGMDGLKKAVITQAIKTENLPIIAAAVVMRHPAVAQVAQELKERALASLASAA
jgi:AcrR family transcriptional regulator